MIITAKITLKTIPNMENTNIEHEQVPKCDRNYMSCSDWRSMLGNFPLSLALDNRHVCVLLLRYFGSANHKHMFTNVWLGQTLCVAVTCVIRCCAGEHSTPITQSVNTVAPPTSTATTMAISCCVRICADAANMRSHIFPIYRMRCVSQMPSGMVCGEPIAQHLRLVYAINCLVIMFVLMTAQPESICAWFSVQNVCAHEMCLFWMWDGRTAAAPRTKSLWGDTKERRLRRRWSSEPVRVRTSECSGVRLCVRSSVSVCVCHTIHYAYSTCTHMEAGRICCASF